MAEDAGVQESGSQRLITRIRKLLAIREAGVLFALLLMGLFLSLSTDTFLTPRNLLNIGRQVSVLGIMAIGMTYLIITGEFDLSIGSIFALTSIVTGLLLLQSWGLFPAILAGLLVGVVLGLINGLLSTVGRLPSFIATLGMLSAVRGVALIITEGQPVTVNARHGGIPEVIDQFYYLGQGRLFDQIPMQLVFFVGIIVVTWFVLSQTTFGFRLYAVGGNPKAARVSGIRVYAVKLWSFVIMGFLSALAGILSLAFLPSAQAGRTGVGVELDVIAAAVVGGAALSGGEGTVMGTVLGVLIIGVLKNGLILLGISPFWQEAIVGIVIIIAVGIDRWTAGRRTR
jgi:ribose transport system permease protein